MVADRLSFRVEEGNRIFTEDPASVNVTLDDAFSVIARFDEIGIWRAELDSGLFYWTDSVFRIFDLEPVPGAVNISDAMKAYHPEDREAVLKCIEQAAKLKTGFRFVLRLLMSNGDIVWVKSHGLYRVSASGGDELYGYIEKFSPRTRSISILK